MYELIALFANQSTIFSLILSFIGCVILFQIRKRCIGKDIPDVWLHWYTPSDVKRFLDDLETKKKRWLYALSEVTVDVIFPVTYGLLAMLTLYYLIGHSQPHPIWLLYLPLVTVAADLLENVTVAWLALTHQTCASPRKLAWVTATSTFIKWRSCFLLLLALVYLLIRVCF